MCVYRTEDGKCQKYSENGIVSFCVDGPCLDDTPTNGDRIRGMTDEELAQALYAIQKSTCVYVLGIIGISKEKINFSENAPDILKWLKQPAKEDS